MADRESPAPGIRWYRNKWRASVSVGGRGARRTTSELFPADTPVKTMRAWQERARTILRATADADAELQPTAAAPVKSTSTLEEAATAYLSTVTGMPSYESREYDMMAWLGPLGAIPLAELTPRQVRLTWNAWRKAGRAASTLNHRRTALRACLAQHDAGLVATMKDAIPYLIEPLPVPRELPAPLIKQLLDAMPPSKTRAFRWVMAETGLPPETLRRLQPDDVDEGGARMTLGVRQKGGKVSGVTLPLTRAAAAAFADYRARNAWGGVTKTAMATVWNRACETVRAGAYPPNAPKRHRIALGPTTPVPDCSPYTLRHSFAGRVLDATGGDVQALQQLLQHKDLETTMRYARARAQRAAQHAIDKLES